MKKTLILFSIAIVVILAVTLIFVFGRKTEPAPGNEPIPGGLPSVATTTIPQGELLVIGTPAGSVSVKNFYKNPVEVNSERDALIERTEQYDIVYLAGDSSFLITISRQPFDAARQAAEDDFLKTLQITKEEACRLNVALRVPRFVDENLAGKDFGLSFCPNSIQFNQ